jgi:hypothetical protein
VVYRRLALGKMYFRVLIFSAALLNVIRGTP